jgi:carbon monoxide dehydrogenase subunit G
MRSASWMLSRCHDVVVATIRREIRIPRPASEVWAIVGDPGSVHRWFPGIVASTVECDDRGVFRTVELASGLKLVERIVTNDPTIRRFQYRIEGGVFREHIGTVDVIPVAENDTLVVYGTDAEPPVMALVIGGAAGPALERLAELIGREGG